MENVEFIMQSSRKLALCLRAMYDHEVRAFASVYEAESGIIYYKVETEAVTAEKADEIRRAYRIYTK